MGHVEIRTSARFEGSILMTARALARSRQVLQLSLQFPAIITWSTEISMDWS